MLSWLSRRAAPRSRPAFGRSYWQRSNGAPEPGEIATAAGHAGWRSKVDYVVVGGGLAGLMTAIRLVEAEPSADIVVLEARFVGFGASGRNAGLVSPLPAPVWMVNADSDREHAWALSRMNKGTHLAAEWLAEHIPRSEVRPATLRIEATGKITAAGLARVAKILDVCRIDNTLDRDPSARAPAVVAVPTHIIDPFATVQGLTAYARRLGVEVRENAPVRRVEDGLHGVDVTLEDGRTIEARAVVIATNAYSDSVQLPSKPRAKVMHNYMLATAELSDEEMARVPGGTPFVVEINSAYVYYRLHARRLIYGGIDKLAQGGDDFAVSDAVLAQLEQLMDQSVPGSRLEAAHAWGGKYHLTSTELPLIKRTGSTGAIVMNVGYGGTGVALTMLCAGMAAGLARSGMVQDPDDRRLLTVIERTRLPVMAGLRFATRVAADLTLPSPRRG